MGHSIRSYSEFTPTTIRRLVRYIYCLCSHPRYYYLTKDDRNDVVQDVLVKLLLHSYKYIPNLALMSDSQRLKELRKLSPRFTRHTCIDYFRKLKNQPVSVANPEVLNDRPDRRFSAESVIEAREILLLLKRNMPKDLASILVLREVQLYSRGEIANILGLNFKEVHVTLQRARRHARRILIQLDVAHG